MANSSCRTASISASYIAFMAGINVSCLYLLQEVLFNLSIPDYYSLCESLIQWEAFHCRTSNAVFFRLPGIFEYGNLREETQHMLWSDVPSLLQESLAFAIWPWHASRFMDMGEVHGALWSSANWSNFSMVDFLVIKLSASAFLFMTCFSDFCSYGLHNVCLSINPKRCSK